MKTLIIYDSQGYIITSITGSYRVPTGIPYLEVEIPVGKQVKSGIGVDVSVTPHEIILEDIPPSEMELLKTENQQIKQSMAELAELILGGMQ